MEYFVHSLQDGTREVNDCEKSKSSESFHHLFQYSSALPGLHLVETTLDFSGKTLLSICRVQTSVVGKEG
jgi:hypothetical protein